MTQGIVSFPKGHYFRLHDDIIDVYAKVIGAYGIAIYGLLSRHMNRKTGQCYPKIDTIAKTLRLGHSTVKKYLRKMEKAGLIESQARRDPEGDPTSNLYTLLDLTPDAIAKRQAQPITPQASEPEGGGSPGNPPSVTSGPTGGLPENPKPEKTLNPQPKELNQETAACAVGEGEETPKEAPPSPALSLLPEPPDEALAQLNLDAPTKAALKAEAIALLESEGAKRHLMFLGAIHSYMLKLWEARQKACHEGMETRGITQGQEEGPAHSATQAA
jgi:Helix-turn-helix domain